MDGTAAQSAEVRCQPPPHPPDAAPAVIKKNGCGVPPGLLVTGYTSCWPRSCDGSDGARALCTRCDRCRCAQHLTRPSTTCPRPPAMPPVLPDPRHRSQPPMPRPSSPRRGSRRMPPTLRAGSVRRLERLHCFCFLLAPAEGPMIGRRAAVDPVRGLVDEPHRMDAPLGRGATTWTPLVYVVAVNGTQCRLQQQQGTQLGCLMLVRCRHRVDTWSARRERAGARCHQTLCCCLGRTHAQAARGGSAVVGDGGRRSWRTSACRCLRAFLRPCPPT